MKALCLALAMLVGCAKPQPEPQRSFSFNSKPIVERFEKDFGDRYKMAQDADAALTKLIARAVEAINAEADKNDRKANKLQARGALWDAMQYRERATHLRTRGERLQTDWTEDYQGFIPKLVALQSVPLGRETPELFTPMSMWLRDWYHEMKDLLGELVMTSLHLDDLQVFNEGTVVVLRLDKMGDSVPTQSVYKQYFCPWTGAVSYWLAYIGCEVAAIGLDIGLLCGPIAMLAEETMYRYIAPRWSDKVYARIYQ